MKRVRVLIVAALVAGGVANAMAAGGTSGAASLKMGVGARGQGLGDAYAATVDGVESLFWNPAGLATGAKRSLMLGFQPLMDDASFQQGAVAGRFGRWGLGVGYSGLDHDDLDAIDDVGNAQGTFGAQDQLLVAGLALGGPRVAFGVTGKFFRSEIDGESADVATADIGLSVASPLSQRFRHALVARHLGGKISYVNQEDPLPTTAVFGTSYGSGKRAVLELDVSWERDLGSYVAGGLEYGLLRAESVGLSVRGGYNTRRNEAGSLSGASFGLGVAVKTFSFDYAWVPFGELGDSHAMTLMWRPSMEPRAPRARETQDSGGKKTLKSAKDKIAPSQKTRKQLDDFEPPRKKK